VADNLAMIPTQEAAYPVPTPGLWPTPAIPSKRASEALARPPRPLPRRWELCKLYLKANIARVDSGQNIFRQRRLDLGKSEEATMAKYDVTKLNVGVDKLLAVTTNPRHRFLLQAYSRHRYLEVAGR
jgi:hypothetical protein